MTVRIGLIGVGGMGRAHGERIQNELAGGEVVAVADVNPDAAGYADSIGARYFPTGPELIADPGVDAVIIATFGKVHAPDVIAAIRAGKPVLCEKPLATTAQDCLDILAAEQEAGRKLVTVGFMRRFDKGYNEMRAQLTEGQHGYATMVHCRHRNPSVPATLYTTRNMIDDTAIHEIDICRFLLDEEITTVRVDTPRRSSNAPQGLQDPLVLVANTASGVRIDDEINVNIKFGYAIECELVMESGTVRLADQDHTILRDIEGDRHAICRSHIDRFHDAFNAEVQQWIRAVERGEHAGSTSWDGYAATCVVDAAIESLEHQGREVAVQMIDQPAFYAG